MSGNIAILPLQCPISRDTFSGRMRSPKMVRYPPWHLVSQRQVCAIHHLAPHTHTHTRAIIARYPIKQACDTIATCIAQYENQKNSRRLELSISKNTPHGRWGQGPGSVDPRFPAGLPFLVPEILDFVAHRDFGKISPAIFPGTFPEFSFKTPEPEGKNAKGKNF